MEGKKEDIQLDETGTTVTMPMERYQELKNGFREIVKIKEVFRRTGPGRGLAVGISVLASAGASALMLQKGVGWGWYFLPFLVAIAAVGSIQD